MVSNRPRDADLVALACARGHARPSPQGRAHVHRRGACHSGGDRRPGRGALGPDAHRRRTRERCPRPALRSGTARLSLFPRLLGSRDRVGENCRRAVVVTERAPMKASTRLQRKGGGKTLRHSRAMSGYAGSRRPKGQKRELAGSNGAVPASKTESGDPVVGLAVRIVEIIAHTLSVPVDVPFGSKADVSPYIVECPLYAQERTCVGSAQRVR